jgi:signal transduction histidine kinase
MKKIILYVVLSFICGEVNAQSKEIEELKIRLSKETVDTLKAKLLMAIGWAYVQVKKDSALFYYQKASGLSTKIQYSRGALEAKYVIAELFIRTGNFPEALKLALQNIKLAEQMHDDESIFQIKRQIMWIYGAIGDQRKALDMATQMKALMNSKSFPRRREGKFGYEMILYNNLGEIYGALNQPDSSLYYLRTAFDMANQSHDPQMSAVIAASLGELYMKTNSYDSAAVMLRISILSAINAGRRDLVNSNRLLMARIFSKRAQLDSAFLYARKSFSGSLHLKDSGRIIDAASLLSDLFQNRRQPDSAYYYLKLSATLTDHLQAADKIAKTQDLLFTETLHQQQLEQERKQAELQYKSNLKIYGLIGGLSVLLLLSLIFYRNSKQKQKDAAKIRQAYHELQATQAQLIQSEKMASLGELTAGIAHEIQNPLNFVNNFSEVNSELIEELQSERSKVRSERVDAVEDEIINDIKQNLEKINHHGKRADAIVKGMLQHSKTSTGVKEPTDINKLADEYLRLSYHGMRAKDKEFNVEIKTDFDNSIGKINIVQQDIGRVLLNLFSNAFYAVNEKKKHVERNLSGFTNLSGQQSYVPTVTIVTKKLNDKVEIRVADNGNGIPQNIVDKIFQPFFTTKPTGQGTGLGLSLSYDTVKAHGGEIKVETKEGEGSEFVIQLPDKVSDIFKMSDTFIA